MLFSKSKSLCLILFGLLALSALAHASLSPVHGEALSVDEKFETQISDPFYAELIDILNKVNMAKSKIRLMQIKWPN